MIYIAFLLLFSLALSLFSHVILVTFYRKQYQEALNSYSSALERLVISSGVIWAFVMLSSDYNKPYLHRVLFVILWLVTLPGYSVISLIFMTKEGFKDFVKRIKKGKKK